MAHNNIEVEIKIPISKKDFLRIKKYLRKFTKFIKSSHHIDDYYSPKHKSFLEPRYPFEWLTVRQRDGKVLFNYKHWYPEGVKNTTHCDEYETEVGDARQLEKILKALDFKKILTIDKTRETYIYRGRLEIALDFVKSLGYFIEVESLKNVGGLKRARGEILEFLRALGIEGTETVPGGYGGALLRKKGLLT